IIRYDYHFNKECAEFVFSEIISWIEANPVNCGPNYRCSQEISLRVLNWTFALHYYRDSIFLSDEIFNKIQFAVYWQMQHVFKNINFSRIAVRNNHAITETLTLYVTGLLYPQFPNADKWKQKGKEWFEEEISYQVYEDGTFLQFSMNYHRVVIQLLTWAIVIAEKNNESFAPIVYERAKKSLEFLRICMIDENGQLPYYGANDGALFFKLNDAGFRDYRPQLDALASALKIDLLFSLKCEDIQWYSLENKNFKTWQPSLGIHYFNSGGYYIFREKDTLTFIRCGSHKDRPLQADNLHLDVWHKGENILIDGGSYKYNTSEKNIKYFMGTASHNTIMLDDYDQMKKGSRFIWYNWTQRKNIHYEEMSEEYCFKGSVYAFSYLSKDIIHEREVIKLKGQPKWIIKDTIINKPDNVSMKQLWHLPLQHIHVLWKSNTKRGERINQQNTEGMVSDLYGKKEPCEMIIFQTKNNDIITEFEIRS
ncbi:MAG: alginate lyase family protein, partial [Ginsengibacter sp.]